MKELAIGEIAVINGKKVKCVKTSHGLGCKLCALDKEYCDTAPECSRHEREDKTNVHFEIIVD